MGISEQSVKNHLSHIFDKLGVSSRLELALYATHHRLADAFAAHNRWNVNRQRGLNAPPPDVPPVGIAGSASTTGWRKERRQTTLKF
jgi:hypothetical protein